MAAVAPCACCLAARPRPTPSLALGLRSPPQCATLRGRGGVWTPPACSTSFPCEGRVGWHRRLGSVSLLSFGINPGGTAGGGGERAAADAAVDSAKALSAMLPFVVAATAVAALVNPSTFSWQEESVCRTISLCTGMQSSTLAGLLATQFLGSSRAVPAACSVVAMAIMGLTLASFWGNGSRIKDIPMLLSPQTCSDANS